MSKRKILFVTERRADYSRLKPIMKGVQASDKLELQLVVTGAHLLKNFGETRKVIEDDGFTIDASFPMFHEDDPDDGVSMVKAMARALDSMADVFPKLDPDIVFCGFDLGAHLAAAIAGMHVNKPVAHIQGGEISGTIDEIIRHACTKFAHIHFVATQESKERVEKLGEDPDYVFLVGSPSLDTIKNIDYPAKEIMCEKYGLDASKKLLVFLQHPVTTEIDNVEDQIANSIAALQETKEKQDVEILVIYSNHDAGGKKIITSLESAGMKVVPHIVYEDFLRILNVADVLVGNSSTGIHEAPSFGLPTVNVGTRQQHRERGVNVLDVGNVKEEISAGIEKSLTDSAFIEMVKNGTNPYEHGDTASQVIKVLEEVKMPKIQKIITY